MSKRSPSYQHLEGKSPKHLCYLLFKAALYPTWRSLRLHSKAGWLPTLLISTGTPTTRHRRGCSPRDPIAYGMVKGTSPSIRVLPRSLPCPANLSVKLQRPPQRERAGLTLALSPDSLLTSFHCTDIWMWPAENSTAIANIYMLGPVMSISHLQTHLIFDNDPVR